MRVLEKYALEHEPELPKWLSGWRKAVSQERGLKLHMADEILNIIIADGAKGLEGYERPGWAAQFIAKADLASRVEDHYGYGASERPEPIDRSSAVWNELVKCTLTLPRGVLLEAATVIEGLALKPHGIEISLSGFVEVALRELLWNHPVDSEDLRFSPEVGGKQSQSPTRPDAISEIVRESGVPLRRKTVEVRP